jgi:hypothetical protein
MCFRISVRKALRERESEARKAIEAELRQMLTNCCATASGGIR